MARSTSDGNSERGERSRSSVGWGALLLSAAIITGLLGGRVLPGKVWVVLFVGLALGGLSLMARTRGPRTQEVDEPPLDTSEMVVATVLPNSQEAAVTQGMLRANGIACRVLQTNFGAGSMDGMPGGPQQILVHPSDLEKARDLLAKAR